MLAIAISRRLVLFLIFLAVAALAAAALNPTVAYADGDPPPAEPTEEPAPPPEEPPQDKSGL